MANGGFNPKRIFWIASLITLVGGIFFYFIKIEFSFKSVYFNANLVHVTAITSGILSMISFGYSYLMKGDYSKLVAISHTLVSIGLMIAILYLNFSHAGHDHSHVPTPTLDADATVIEQWDNMTSKMHSDNELKGLLATIWLGIQVLFFAIIGFKKYRSKS